MDLRRSIKSLVKTFKKKSAPKPFDEEAKVKRVEDDTVWVRLPGMDYDTPVEKTINVEPGDTVKVRSSGGRGWITGNNTAPPTDDKTAEKAMQKARIVQYEAAKAYDLAHEADKLAGFAMTSANGKNRTYYSTTEPTGIEFAVGDLWFKMIVVDGHATCDGMYRWNGAEWELQPLSDGAFASLDVGKLVGGYIDAGHINAGLIRVSALNDDVGVRSASLNEQYIYISKASGTNSVAANTTWVTRADDVQNTWTTKRPTYSNSYPVLFVAKQKKTVGWQSGDSVECTTPVKDDTTTVIDGGHITTGTIDASQVNVTNIDASEIKSGYLNADRIEGGSLTIGKTNGLQTELDDKVGTSMITGKNLLPEPTFTSATLPTGWTKESSAVLSFENGLLKISVPGSYYGIRHTLSVENDTDYVISATVGPTFKLGFGSGNYPQEDSTPWSRAGDGRVYKVVHTSGTSYRIYAYAEYSTTPNCYINNIKVEKGNKYTGWYPAGSTLGEQINETGKASQYVTHIDSENGVRVFSGSKDDPACNTSYTQIKSDGLTVALNGHLGAHVTYREDGSAFGLSDSHRVVVAKATDESGYRNDATLSSRLLSSYTSSKPMGFVNVNHKVSGDYKYGEAGLYAWGGNIFNPYYVILTNGNTDNPLGVADALTVRAGKIIITADHFGIDEDGYISSAQMSAINANLADAMDAIDGLRDSMSDYVTSEGSSGDWKYRKWNSGKIEAWFGKSITAGATTAAGNVYRSDFTQSIPSEIFTEAPRVFTSIDGNASTVFGINGYATSATSITGRIFRTGSSSSSYSIGVDIYAVQN